MVFLLHGYVDYADIFRVNPREMWHHPDQIFGDMRRAG